MFVFANFCNLLFKGLVGLQNKLILNDAGGQGTLIMGKEQLKIFRAAPSPSSCRIQVPGSNMKLWYELYLQLPGVVGIQGGKHLSQSGEPQVEAGMLETEIMKWEEGCVGFCFGFFRGCL